MRNDELNMARKIIIALDVKNREEAWAVLESLPEARLFKVGLELYTAEGPAMIDLVKSFGKEVFLDLKLHDIPNTVAGAVKSAVRHGVAMLTLHTSGGREMMKKAVEAARETAAKENKPLPLILGVTVLTSLKDSDLQEIGFSSDARNQVLRLARLAVEAGIEGIVCSPQELEPLRAELGSRVRIITPGIRPAWAEAQDQKRIMTPGEAIKKGADFLVIGRPITQAPVPREAFSRVLEELQAAVEGA
ncbi:MAG: Orotidine 5'-phosphate decarboxylase [Candidatus Saccharicenans subterraneus]|uniref:Orotidine 5'-phosphate decarboxylase n=1 Tax=Candidatus Saccharicenans subterraneus TaxID=2508984 RepID=A0A3E2BPU6_9BACT|nr:MAG: Orotidine 5'-phosphate decarboxylase [Candidatus Saccharicenans subterraneum]